MDKDQRNTKKNFIVSTPPKVIRVVVDLARSSIERCLIAVDAEFNGCLATPDEIDMKRRQSSHRDGHRGASNEYVDDRHAPDTCLGELPGLHDIDSLQESWKSDNGTDTGTEADPNEEHKKEPMVVEPNTVGGPRAMMVPAQTTFVAYRTVVSSWRLV